MSGQADPLGPRQTEVVDVPLLGNAFLGSIHGFKFEDVDGDGDYDDGVDQPLAGVVFTLSGVTGLGQPVDKTASTDDRGEFAFTGLVPSVAGQGLGTGYTVSEELPQGFAATTAASVTLDVESRQELVALPLQSGVGHLDIDFGEFAIGSYGGGQDEGGSATIENSGATLHLVGNTWKKIDLSYNVTADTVLEFDFKSTTQGEIHGIGFDTDDGINADRTFQLYGKQVWGIQDYDDYGPAAPAYKHYRIPVGQYYTGPVNNLFFVNDHDVEHPTGESFFHNVKISQGSMDDPRVEVLVGPLLTFGNTVLGSIHGFKFEDVDGDGEYDAGVDHPLAGVKFTLTGTTGLGQTVFETTYTDAQGGFGFTGLMPSVAGEGQGTGYTVTEAVPHGFVATTPVSVTGDLKSRQEVVAFPGQSGIGRLDIDFEDFTIRSYGGDAGAAGSATVEDSGATLHLAGNTWKKIDLSYNVTADTVLEFDFKSESQGEIHGIGLDTDDWVSADRTFQLYGKQVWGIQDFDDYGSAAPGYKHYRIPVGQYYTGPMKNLFFVNDHDVARPTGEGVFHNVRISEGFNDDPRVEVVVGPLLTFGNTVPGSIHGFKFEDMDGDGHFDASVDQPLSGVKFTLTGITGLGQIVIRTTYTDSQGKFGFAGLMPSVAGEGQGTGYTVTETVPYGFVATTPVSVTGDLRSREELVVFPGQSGIGRSTADFRDFTIGSYGGGQDTAGLAAVENAGATLHLLGNTWKKIDLDYNVTTDTILEFDFKSASQGEIHGIGLDTDDEISADRTFQLYGKQVWGIQDFDDYGSSAPGYKHYRIPVGLYYTGPVNRLFFVNDHDVPHPTGESFFRNVKIAESSTDDPRFEVVVGPLLAFGNRAREIIVIGSDKGHCCEPVVKIFDKFDGEVVAKFLAYEHGYRGGVRVATGDLTGDGVDEIVTAPGRVHAPEVRVFTQLGEELTQFRTLAYASHFDGGVHVAVGDVDGDGRNDIVTSPSSGPSEIKVFRNVFDPKVPLEAQDPIQDTPYRSFLAFPSHFIGGSVVDVADMGTFFNGAVVDDSSPDGKAEIIVGSGPGMQSIVKVFDTTPASPAVVRTFLPFDLPNDEGFRGGLSIDMARITADAIPDLIVGAGNGGESRVEVWDGRSATKLSSFQAYSDSSRNAPVRVAGLDKNHDGRADFVVTAQGVDGQTREIRCFRPLSGELVDSVLEDDPDFCGGYFLDVVDGILEEPF
jgi:hypothetical protein